MTRDGLDDAAAAGGVAHGDASSDVTRLFLVRHGETDWNVDNRLQGQTDIPLNARGEDQALRLGRALADEPLAAVYSSDLGRALATARALAAPHGLAVHTDTGLRERGFGVFEGLTYTEVAERWPEANRRWREREPDFGPEGGEVLEAFFHRSVAVVQRLAARHHGASVALVTHGGVLDCLYRAASGVPLRAPRVWAVGNAAIHRLLHADGRLALVGWNDDEHLR